jgi:hypothetical protein
MDRLSSHDFKGLISVGSDEVLCDAVESWVQKTLRVASLRVGRNDWQRRRRETTGISEGF